MTDALPHAASATPAEPAMPRPLIALPDEEGRFGAAGGRAEDPAARAALDAFEAEYLARIAANDRYWGELTDVVRTLTSRPTPLQPAWGLQRAASAVASANPLIWLKREDLAPETPAQHAAALAVALMASVLDRGRVYADAPDAPAALAAATACATIGVACVLFPSFTPDDEARAALAALAATVVLAEAPTTAEPGTPGAGLGSGPGPGFAAWVADAAQSVYLPARASGPHPLPVMRREFEAFIGRETKAQSIRHLQRLPAAVICPAGPGAIGAQFAFLGDAGTRLITASIPGPAAAAWAECPEPANWRRAGRAEFREVDVALAQRAARLAARREGLLLSLGSGAALAVALEMLSTAREPEPVIVLCDARGPASALGDAAATEAEPTSSDRRPRRRRRRNRGEDGPGDGPSTPAAPHARGADDDGDDGR